MLWATGAAAQPRPAALPDEGRLHTLIVPGGRATLDALGVPPELPRALVLTELVRRLHFVNDDAPALARAIRALRTEAGPAPAPSPLTLPLPLSEQTWRRVVFRRDVPAAQLFAAILTEPRARLLYHGLMGLDAETRGWLGSHPDLLGDIAGNEAAVKAFALFSPALRVRGGVLVVPGGEAAARRWSAVLDTDVTRLERFVNRLFSREDGRLAGLYFTLANSEPGRRTFLLGPANDDEAFAGLVSRFVACYGAELNIYPFNARFNDPVLVLLELTIGEDGQLAGPVWRRFWARAMDGDSLPDDPARELRDVREDGAVDAGSLVAAVCEAPPEVRPLVFETLVFAQRVFGRVTDAELPDALVAVRARRLFPAVMMVLEQAGVTAPATYARVARRAAQLARLEDPRPAILALQQFQGALALTVAAIRAGTVAPAQRNAILEALAAVPFEDGRYGGRLARWFVAEWPGLSGVKPSAPTGDASLEAIVADAVAGPPGNGQRVSWEGLDYVLDLAADVRRQALEARRRQGGPTLDSVRTLIDILAALRAPAATLDHVAAARARLSALRADLAAFQPAVELLDDVPDVARRVDGALEDLRRIDEPRRVSRARDVADDLEPLVDVVFGHVLAAWAYAPHLGDGAAQTLGTAGDLSRRHEFGVRLPGRARLAQRWEIAWPMDSVGGHVAGSLLGLDVSLARRALRRIQSDVLPREPVLTATDVASMQVTVALTDPRRLTDDVRDRISAALAAGRAAVDGAGGDATALEALSVTAASSAWRTQVIGWVAAEEPERIAAWFAPDELARIGGLDARIAHAWGTAFRPSGCVCLRMPRVQSPDVLMGRALAAVLPHLSPGVMLRIADVLAQHRLPAPLAAAVQRFAMRAVIDRAMPAHAADLLALTRAIDAIDRTLIEDYIGAVAAGGPLVPAANEQ